MIPNGKVSELGISIHTLRVEGDDLTQFVSLLLHISIHTLRVEGDTQIKISRIFFSKFQSTPSAWRVTEETLSQLISTIISIHTLRVEGDDTTHLQYIL